MIYQYVPSELLFSIVYDKQMDIDIVYICPIEYFYKNGGLDTNIGDHNCEKAFSELIQYNIFLYELMEGAFEVTHSSNMDISEVKSVFLECGFMEDSDFDEMFK